jgi:hypothetical protein
MYTNILYFIFRAKLGIVNIATQSKHKIEIIVDIFNLHRDFCFSTIAAVVRHVLRNSSQCFTSGSGIGSGGGVRTNRLGLGVPQGTSIAPLLQCYKVL